MRTANTILGIIRDRGTRGLPLEDVYRQLYNPELYLLAYGKIARNQGAMTPGVTTVRLVGELVGYRLRTRAGVRAVVVHAGWRVDAETARAVVLSVNGRGRTPEPLGQVCRAFLSLLGCQGPGSVYCLAQIVAAAAVCLELSALASASNRGSENFAMAHLQQSGRA